MRLSRLLTLGGEFFANDELGEKNERKEKLSGYNLKYLVVGFNFMVCGD